MVGTTKKSEFNSFIAWYGNLKCYGYTQCIWVHIFNSNFPFDFFFVFPSTIYSFRYDNKWNNIQLFRFDFNAEKSSLFPFQSLIIRSATTMRRRKCQHSHECTKRFILNFSKYLYCTQWYREREWVRGEYIKISSCNEPIGYFVKIEFAYFYQQVGWILRRYEWKIKSDSNQPYSSARTEN